jgi:hypothetical protein
MLADPLPIAASYITAADIPRISSEQNKAVYKITVSSVDYLVTIQHTESKGRRRSIVRLDATKLSTNPFDSTSTVEDTTSTYLVIDRHERYVPDTAVGNQVIELLGVLDAATFANVTSTRITSIVGGQS